MEQLLPPCMPVSVFPNCYYLTYASYRLCIFAQSWTPVLLEKKKWELTYFWLAPTISKSVLNAESTAVSCLQKNGIKQKS